MENPIKMMIWGYHYFWNTHLEKQQNNPKCSGCMVYKTYMSLVKNSHKVFHGLVNIPVPVGASGNVLDKTFFRLVFFAWDIFQKVQSVPCPPG